MAQKGIQSTKRVLIDKANYLMFISIAVASALIAVTIVAVNYLSKMNKFQAEVNQRKGATLEITKKNITNFEVVKATIDDLRNSQSLIDAAKGEEYVREPLRVVANALPAQYNLAAFGASIANLIITRISGNATGTPSISVGRDSTVLPQLVTTAQPMNLTIQVTGSLGCDGNTTACASPQGIAQILNNLERSIRMISINSATFSFRGPGQVELSIQANGYYTTERFLSITRNTLTGKDVLDKPQIGTIKPVGSGGIGTGGAVK